MNVAPVKTRPMNGDISPDEYIARSWFDPESPSAAPRFLRRPIRCPAAARKCINYTNVDVRAVREYFNLLKKPSV